MYRCPFTRSPIRDMIEGHYARTGEVDLSLLEGGEFILQECLSCRLIFQQQVPNDQLMEVVYERWIDPEKSLHRKESHLPARGRMALEIMSVVDYLGRPPETLKFLDFGMGWGLWVRMAEAFGVQAWGLERSESRMARAEQTGVKLVDPDRLGDYSFDFINTEQVFEHLAEPLPVARLLSSLLAKDGILKISVPNGIRVRRNLAIGAWTAPKGSPHNLYDVLPLEHINCFLHRSLVALGERAGLRPVPIPARLRYRYMPTWERLSRLLVRVPGQHYRALRRQETIMWFRRAASDPEPTSSEQSLTQVGPVS